MDPGSAVALLGGLSPDAFMRRHWQRKPLLVRQALPGAEPPLSRAALFALAASDSVESRLIVQEPSGWRLRHGPLSRRALPPLKQPRWTLLVQGLDLHVPQARSLLERFRFVPDARLDDLMLSWASDGGGVGPHLDSYDVFLIQVLGRRRWRIGRAQDRSLVDGVPLKILRRFQAEQEWLLEPGDMLYLPPGWAHDGVAVGECMTASVGFRSPALGELARELLPRLADAVPDGKLGTGLYRDAGTGATDNPGAIPPAMQAFAAAALQRVMHDPLALKLALGEWLSEPKPQVWFDALPHEPSMARGVRLQHRTRMLYDEHHVFVNGQAWRASGRDARLLRQLADRRRLGAAECAALGKAAREGLRDWLSAGWLEEGSE